MKSHISINFDYSKSTLLDMFNSVSKTAFPRWNKANLPAGVNEFVEFESYFNAFTFLLKEDDTIEISELTANTKPHVNPGNNGLIVFPISGTLTLNTYSYVSKTLDQYGRRAIDTAAMTEEEQAQIESTLIESVDITSPMAIDGLTTFSLHPKDGSATVLFLKIPMNVQWDQVIAELTKSQDLPPPPPAAV